MLKCLQRVELLILAVPPPQATVQIAWEGPPILSAWGAAMGGRNDQNLKSTYVWSKELLNVTHCDFNTVQAVAFLSGVVLQNLFGAHKKNSYKNADSE